MKTCTRCLAPQPPEAFKRDRSRTDGRFPWCRACCRDDYAARRDGEHVAAPTKRCSRCRRRKAAASFTVNRAQKDGLEKTCRRCRWQRWRARHRREPRVNLAPRVRAYLAGLFDGEGSVRIAFDRKGGYSVLMNITNTHEGVMRWLQATLGGNVWRHAAAGPRNQASWRWGVSTQASLWLLGQMAPHLIIKNRHAEVARAFYDGYDRWQHSDDTRNPHLLTPPEGLPEHLRGLLDEMPRLNHRGGHHP